MVSTVYAITLVVMALIAAVFCFVLVNSKKVEADYSTVTKKWYGIRGKWFFFLLTLGVIITYLSLSPFPIPDQKKGYQENEYQVVKVDSYQWYWTMTPNTVEAGKPVTFLVTSGDVNHGFGIYDENLELLGQTQAMPGYTNKLIHTFDKPGKYKILCLEYCGVAHHAMITELTVK
ncbi:cytochrome c oxidase subunit II [Nitrosomonas communis]|uniref:Cytochrome C oxidase subunit II n=2 Tax=Nitrosomonadaceae TaxID=206379 RepID=A0A0F7KAU2_9PROT|nr:cytochrome c oxidase subunit II [Nitrosomonas communis]AKH37455.1 cytochrome C oxidase subunit II [Nitrosomonas communis]TYP86381.1 cytochrome c oxidase subunit 2 [Nitrosomonas communis]